MKNLSKKELKALRVEINEVGGFTLWAFEEKIINGKKHKIRHWLIDGSCVTEDASIRISNSNCYKINAIYDESENLIKLVKL